MNLKNYNFADFAKFLRYGNYLSNTLFKSIKSRPGKPTLLVFNVRFNINSLIIHLLVLYFYYYKIK